MSAGLRVLTFATALGCATVAGVFFAFSAFVMRGLARLPAPQGIAAMQSINVAAVRPPLMIALFGTAAACVPLAGYAIRSWGDLPATLLLAGAAVYLAGAVGLTAGYHVPRNDRLARIDPAGAGAAEHWAAYVRGWTRGNHVRAASSLAAAGALIGSLLA